MKKNEKDEYGMTALHYAALDADEAEVTRLLEAGFDPNILNEEGQAPIFNVLTVFGEDGVAQRASRAVIFRQLWDVTNTDIRAGEDNDGYTVLQLMAIFGFDVLIQETLLREPSLAKKTMRHTLDYPIHTAILNAMVNQHGEHGLAVIKALFESDPDCATYRNAKGQTALHYAVCYGHLDMVEYCTQYYNNRLDEIDHDGITALGMLDSSSESADEIRGYLIGQGAHEPVVSGHRSI